MRAPPSPEILDTHPVPARIVAAAARLVGLPMAALLLPLDSGDTRSVAAYGFSGVIAPSVRTPPGGEPLSPTTVPDLRKGPRYADWPPVAGATAARCFASAPVFLPDGSHLGDLCVFGPRPGKMCEGWYGVLLGCTALLEAALDDLDQWNAAEEAEALPEDAAQADLPPWQLALDAIEASDPSPNELPEARSGGHLAAARDAAASASEKNRTSM